MQTADMVQRLKLALSLMEEVGDALNDSGKACPCCSLVVRENIDDFQGKQAIDASANRIARMIDKLLEGKWQGRDLAPVVSAEDLRGRPVK